MIIGGLDTIRRSKPGEEARIRRAANMALQGAQRAASLTGRLLAFSRRQPLEPRPLELNALVRDMTDLLHSTLGEHIELECVLTPRLWAIEADQNQLESAILNLAVNARDAMPDGGHVTIYSEEGQGASVKLYFPRYLGGAQAEAVPGEGATPLGSEGEVVLVVEDNDEVRAYSVAVLTELGYRVLEAPEAESALAILRSDQRIDLLFSDVILPGKSGRVLADAAADLRPDLTVLFTTGYSRNAIVHHGRLDPGVPLITKPFTFDQLATRVRDLLDRRSEGR